MLIRTSTAVSFLGSSSNLLTEQYSFGDLGHRPPRVHAGSLNLREGLPFGDLFPLHEDPLCALDQFSAIEGALEILVLSPGNAMNSSKRETASSMAGSRSSSRSGFAR